MYVLQWNEDPFIPFLLNFSIDFLFPQDHPLTKLRVEIAPGVDPDDTYNETPYEKGYIFLCYLQSLVGDVEVFDNFLKSYVKKFAYKVHLLDKGYNN